MTLRDIRIDEEIWGSAPEARRLEWRAAIRGLLQAADEGMRAEGDRLWLSLSEQAVLLELRDAQGSTRIALSLPHDLLARLIQEYVDIVRQMGHDDGFGGVRRLATLDLAKRATHDQAGRVLVRACRPLGLEHEAARRLFTLLLGLRVDTSRLGGVGWHQRGS